MTDEIVRVTCPACEGKGLVRARGSRLGFVQCERCNGSGEILRLGFQLREEELRAFGLRRTLLVVSPLLCDVEAAFVKEDRRGW